MNQMPSTTTSEWKKMTDFGTYHHSTHRASEKIREKIKILFIEIFGDMPFARDDKLKILDVGCGLGFLSCVCAEYYPKAKVTGIDTFEHASLKGSSLTKAKNNAKILKFSERLRFQKVDVFSSDYSKEKFNLFVSNLVFHNFGRKRFDAYQRLAQWMTPKSYIVLGDLFFHYKTDSRRLASHFGKLEERPGSDISEAYKVLVMSERKK
jgi:ribosomal protein L11 methylase PrmA